MTAYSQPDSRWRGPAYDYLRESDELPTFTQLGEDPVARVKLFGGGAYRYYVFAATFYPGVAGPVLTGFVTGMDADEFGDQDIKSMAEVRFPPLGLPMERDLHFAPLRLSELRERVARGDHP